MPLETDNIDGLATMGENIGCTHESFPWVSTTLDDNIIFHPPDPSRIDPSPMPEPLKNYLQEIMTTRSKKYQEAITAGKIPTDDEKEIMFREARRRIIFRHWPRAPDGDRLLPDTSIRGKEAGNGIPLWGATLFDFYRTQRLPDFPHLSTISTGSKLMEWMKAHGETETCADEIRWAESEEKPHVVKPYDIARLLREEEARIRSGQVGKMLGTKEAKAWGLDQPELKGTPFDYTLSPLPWPMEPFSYEPTRLNEKLRLHRLPRKLYIHAPHPLISMEPYDESDYVSYCEIKYPPFVPNKAKIPVFEYGLRLTSQASKKWDEEEDEIRVEKERIEAKDAEGAFGFMMPLPSSVELGPVEPRVFIIHGPPPELLEPPAAHLYLSTNVYIGGGRHSRVYRAEMDLPRDSLVPEVFCKQCAIDDVLKKIGEEDGENGETKAEEWKEKRGFLKRVWKVKKQGVDVNVLDARDINKVVETITIDKDEGEWVIEYEGPLRRIRTDVGYQNPMRGRPYCEHVKEHDFGSSVLHPNTARVGVIVKSQRRDDGRIHDESRKYASFPDHFFEHWNGYNAIPPLHDPVPIGAIVPQYYGTYDPLSGADSKILSPILLLEDCGGRVPKWRKDDINECAGMIYRLHEANWTLRALGRPKPVRQPGPLWLHPDERRQHGGATGIDSRYNFRFVGLRRVKDMTNVSRYEALDAFREDQGLIKAISYPLHSDDESEGEASA